MWLFTLNLAWYDWVGILGTLMVLGAYFWLQTGKLSSDSMAYQLLNLVGAGSVLISLFGKFNVSVFLLEGTWVAISAYGLWRTLKASRASNHRD